MPGSLATVMYWAVHTTLCSANCQAVAIPSGDAASQEALNGAAVEIFEDLRVHAKTFQHPERGVVLSFRRHNCIGVLGP